MNAHIVPYQLIFKQPAGTSRGVLKTKETFFLILQDGAAKGIGEINLFRGLSADDRPGFEQQLQWLCAHIDQPIEEIKKSLMEWPSILFGYEMAVKSLQSSDPFGLFDNTFTQGKKGIPINGLVWMGDHDFMLRQIEEKLTDGFDCIKLKIGAIDFKEELSLLARIRKEYSAQEIVLRVDANGAFTPENALRHLQELAQYDLHSIEQPIKQGQWDAMAQLCANTPLPIALDEELIGLYTKEEQTKCIKAIQPQYIILKPALVGGFAQSSQWIQIAEQHNIDWWITSALESNIGLNAIAQYTHQLGVSAPQGLGTGGLYTNNIDSPLYIKKGELHCNLTQSWDTNVLNF